EREMGMILPKMYRIRQKLDPPVVADVAAAVRAEIARLDLGGRLKPGGRVAVTGGSRGVANIATILRATCDALKALGAKPFIVPAMGSHGGATAEGQLQVLARYGVTPASMDVPILASMETVEIGRMSWGLPVLVDKHAFEADHIVLVNRVKPHTNFRCHVESGLMKMLVIGLGKHQGALLAHRAAVDVGLDRMVPEVARYSLSKLPILFGLATVENVRHQTARVQAMLPEALEEMEARLLKEAWSLLGRIPFDFLHLLIIDQMGKDISGTGMDPNVIGRMYLFPNEEPKSPRYVRILVRDLTETTAGNAVGMGLADFSTRRLANKINFQYTYTNSLTGLSPMRGKMPIIFETDRQAVEGALKTIGLTDPPRAKVARIRNTLAVEYLQASEALLPGVKDRSDLEIVDGPWEFRFSEAGDLVDEVPLFPPEMLPEHEAD
ncbi:MAG TPA: lactate racemase domain-containing protein, partial [Candidatus Methylomirabilis sp.]|nr:lactate racemase domain-containing protein [Candidatus Methylomirabilis sp.]